MSSYQQPGYPAPGGQPPQQPKKKKSATGAVVGTVVGVVALTVIATGAYVIITSKRSGDEQPASAAPAAATTPSGSPTQPGRTAATDPGGFSVTVPDNGWEVDTTTPSSVASGAPSIITSSSIADYKAGKTAVPGFTVVDLTKSSMTPEAYLAAYAKIQSNCSYSEPKPFEHGDFTGSYISRGPCPAKNGSPAAADSAIIVGATSSAGPKLALVVHFVDDGKSTQQAALAALDSYAAN